MSYRCVKNIYKCLFCCCWAVEGPADVDKTASVCNWTDAGCNFAVNQKGGGGSSSNRTLDGHTTNHQLNNHDHTITLPPVDNVELPVSWTGPRQFFFVCFFWSRGNHMMHAGYWKKVSRRLLHSNHDVENKVRSSVFYMSAAAFSVDVGLESVDRIFSNPQKTSE